MGGQAVGGEAVGAEAVGGQARRGMRPRAFSYQAGLMRSSLRLRSVDGRRCRRVGLSSADIVLSATDGGIGAGSAAGATNCVAAIGWGAAGTRGVEVGLSFGIANAAGEAWVGGSALGRAAAVGRSAWAPTMGAQLPPRLSSGGRPLFTTSGAGFGGTLVAAAKGEPSVGVERIAWGGLDGAHRSSGRGRL